MMPYRVARAQTDYDRALDLAAWANLGLPEDRRITDVRALGVTAGPQAVRCMAQAANHEQCRLTAQFPEGGIKRFCLVHYRKYLEALQDIERAD